MRILIAVAPTMYREALAHIIRGEPPNHDVRLADLDALDREASSFRPHLIVCTDGASEVREVSVLSWIVIRYHDSLSASVFLNGQDPRLIQDIAIEVLLGVVEETQKLFVRGSCGRDTPGREGLRSPVGLFFLLILLSNILDGNPVLEKGLPDGLAPGDHAHLGVGVG